MAVDTTVWPLTSQLRGNITKTTQFRGRLSTSFPSDPPNNPRGAVPVSSVRGRELSLRAAVLKAREPGGSRPGVSDSGPQALHRHGLLEKGGRAWRREWLLEAEQRPRDPRPGLLLEDSFFPPLPALVLRTAGHLVRETAEGGPGSL